MQNKINARYIMACLFLYSAVLPSAQAQKRLQYAELHIGMGIINEKVSSVSAYHAFLFTPRYSISISKKQKKNHLFFFHAEPQLNPVAILSLKQNRTVEDENANPAHFEWETGLNAGFDYHYYFKSCYLLLGFGSGLHYISASIAKQANGFIFSDNFYAGLGKTFNNRISAIVKVNFRHLSNAGLKEPNYGIDNFFLLFGIAKRI